MQVPQMWRALGLSPWTKPNLGIEDWKGSKDNNIILQTGYPDAHFASLVVAPTEKDPNKKYKLYHWAWQFK